MTEIPEHLLKRAAAARAARSGNPAESTTDDAPAADTPSDAASAAAPAPTLVEEPPAPKPASPYVEAGLSRKLIPAWVIPVLLFLPIWALYYVGYLERPPEEHVDLLAEGGEVYSTNCAGCHGGGGEGGSGRQLADGEVLLTFPSLEAGASFDGLAQQIAWVANGTAGTTTSTYGDPDRVGGARTPGSFGGAMAGFGGLSAEELVSVVLYERATHGELEAAAVEDERHLLEEVAHLLDEEGPDLGAGVSVEDIQAVVDEARQLIATGGEAAAE